jgi:hypothetical protein
MVKRVADQEKIDKLKFLKIKGLYNGDLRKKPTRYALSQIKKYEGVLSGREKVITAPSRKIAKEISNNFPETTRFKGKKIIARTMHPSEKVFYSKKEKTIISRYKNKDGETITHEYVKPENGRLPELRENERYALPFARGAGNVAYIERASEEEILALANQYETKEKNPYRGATGHLQIVYPGTKRKRKARVKPPSGENVIPFKPRGR